MLVSVFDPSNGLLTGLHISGNDSFVQSNIPAGMLVVPGKHDHLCRSVNTCTDNFGNLIHTIVPYQPPSPPSDADRTWQWDATIERWIPVPTDTSVANDVQAEIRKRVRDCLDVIADAMAANTPLPATWRKYLKDLRAIPAQPGFPRQITWPTPPA